jgi:hypothetical protein
MLVPDVCSRREARHCNQLTVIVEVGETARKDQHARCFAFNAQNGAQYVYFWLKAVCQ